MVRRYEPKRRRLTPQQRDRRMRRAVELRDSGLSLRQIAADLGVGVATIHRDLARWERISVNLTPLPLRPDAPRGGVWSTREGGALLEDRTSVPHGRSTLPPGGAKRNTDVEHPGSNIVPLRRSS